MKKYGMLSALYMSFYSRPLYRDVAKRWGFSILIYLFLISLLFAGYYVEWTRVIINDVNQRYMPTIARELPAITIQKATITTPEKRPYIISQPDLKKRLVVIDTSGTINSIKEANTYIFLNSENLYYNFGDKDVQQLKIPATLDMIIDGKKIQRYFVDNKNSILSGALFIFFFYFVIRQLILSFLGMFIAKLMALIVASYGTIHLSWGGAFRLSVVASTPILLFGIVGGVLSFLTHFNFSYPGSIAILAYLLYLFFAVDANKST